MRHLIFILLLLAVMCSCRKKDDNTNDNPVPAGSVIMPLKVGNYWDYVDSNFTKGPLVFTDTVRLSITGSKVIIVGGNTRTVFLWTWTSRVMYGAPGSWFVENLADGLNFCGGTTGQTDFIFSECLAWKYPVTAGTTWSYNEIIYTSYDSSFYMGYAAPRNCISTNSLFHTPLGDYHCIEYQHNRTYPKTSGMTESGLYDPAGSDRYPVISSDYFMPDLGYLGTVDRDNGVITHTRTLISCHLN